MINQLEKNITKIIFNTFKEMNELNKLTIPLSNTHFNLDLITILKITHKIEQEYNITLAIDNSIEFKSFKYLKDFINYLKDLIVNKY